MMSIPITTAESPVYVHISSTSAQLENLSPSANIALEDVHICGICKQSFSDINLFVEHKQTCCLGTQKQLQISDHQLRQLAPNYLTATPPAGDTTIPSLTVPCFRVIFDGMNLQMHPSTEHAYREFQTKERETQILWSRLLESPAEQHINIEPEEHDYQAKQNDIPEMVLHHQHQQQPRREFQIDEEDVATLLANQLANEVVNSAQALSSPSRSAGLLAFSGVAPDMLLQEGRGSVHMGEMALPREKPVTMSMSPDGDRQEKGSTTLVESHEQNLTPTQETPKSCHSPATTINNTTKSPSAKKRHECKVANCSFTTTYHKDLARHMRTHTGERPFHCSACQRSFSRNDKLQVHLRIHSGEKPHQCKQCNYATIDSGSLRKHMRIHNDERPYKCQMCPYRSRDCSQLTVHLRTHTGDNPFVCRHESCTAAFKTSSDLKRHIRMHTGEKPFSCGHCDYRCAIKSNLGVHVRLNHTEVKSIPCAACDHTSTSRRAAKDHEKIHAEEVLTCGVCSYTCVNTAAMKSHLKTHANIKPFACKHCNYTCRQHSNLKNHQKKKHAELRVPRKGRGGGREGSTGKGVAKPFCVKSHLCTVCDAAFVREDSWRSHMRQHKAVGDKISIPLGESCASASTLKKGSAEKEQAVLGVEGSTDWQKVSGGSASDVESQPVLVYVQNGDVGTGSDMSRATPLLLTGLSLPPEQNTLLEQLSASLQPGMQYVLSGPLDEDDDAFMSVPEGE